MIRDTDTPTALINARVVTPDGVRDDLAVCLRQGRIEALATSGIPDDADVIDLLGRYLLPGFVDVQVNGGGGVLFNDAPTMDSLRTMTRAHAAFGTTAMLATLISDDLEVVERGREAVDAAIAAGLPGLLGLHIEGPFINEARRGVHDAAKIRALTAPVLEQLRPLEHGPTLITVAPECLEPGMVRRLVERGFTVSAGHSAATGAELVASIDEGLSGITHLFNAMSPLGSREPGMVGAALDSEAAYCGLIADGVHVSDTSVRIAWRCKGRDRMVLVTDAMPPVGTQLEHFELLGANVSVVDGICRDERGALAGSCLDMASAVRNIRRITGCSLSDAAVMASTTPAAFLGITGERGAIATGLAADFAILDHDLRPVATIIGGRTAWTASGGPRPV